MRCLRATTLVLRLLRQSQHTLPIVFNTVKKAPAQVRCTACAAAVSRKTLKAWLKTPCVRLSSMALPAGLDQPPQVVPLAPLR